MEVDAEQFIGQKSFKARGKRITTLNIAAIDELPPTRVPEPEAETATPFATDGDALTDAGGDTTASETIHTTYADDAGSDADGDTDSAPNFDPETGQFNLFD